MHHSYEKQKGLKAKDITMGEAMDQLMRGGNSYIYLAHKHKHTLPAYNLDVYIKCTRANTPCGLYIIIVQEVGYDTKL